MKNKYQEALDIINTSDDEKFIKDSRAYFDEYKINPVSVIQELVDKATPKKPIGKYTDYKCPICGRRVRSGKGSSSHQRDNVCQRCYQVLDWSD